MKHLRSPLSQVKGLGSAKEGTDHFWLQRLTALALIPLLLWLCFSVAALPSMSQEEVRLWMAKPTSAVLLVLFLIAAFYHAKLGLQMVIEDYVGNHATRTAAIILVTFACILLAVIGIFSVLRVTLGG
ncbi:MAG: succinate dehydrogenase, hydrophobic membrane anchor protein [Gammaproteobacteria bacterium]|nr:succinate dehydrogenase, hydrophobic membrane anchor protein [Gammaproteobacteria bacterium]